MTIWKYYHFAQTPEKAQNALARAQGDARQTGRLAGYADLPGGDCASNRTYMHISISLGDVFIRRVVITRL